MIKLFLLVVLSVNICASIGTVMAMKGRAKIERLNKILSLKSGMELLEKDSITTDKASRVQVMLKDDTVVTIGANSSFNFEEFTFNNTKDSKVSMRAKRGFFRSVTGKIGQIAPQRFKVKTATTTIGIRGTDFSGNIFEEKEIIKCFSGTITVEVDGNSFEVDAGMMVSLSSDKSLAVKVVKQKMNENKSETKEQKKEQKKNKKKDESQGEIKKEEKPTQAVENKEIAAKESQNTEVTSTRSNFTQLAIGVEQDFPIKTLETVMQESVVEKPIVKKPVVEEPTEEPVVEEPIAEEPAEEPVVEEPFDIAPIYEERDISYDDFESIEERSFDIAPIYEERDILYDDFESIEERSFGIVPIYGDRELQY